MYLLEFVSRLSDVIALEEGYYIRSEGKLVLNPEAPDVVRANNPGALIWPNLPIIGDRKHRISVFSTITAGWVALSLQIRVNVQGREKDDPYPLRGERPMSLYQFFGGQRDKSGKVLPGGYPGFAKNGKDPRAYAETAAAALGISPNAPLIKVIH